MANSELRVAETRIPEALDEWECQAALAFEEAAAALDLESWIVERLRYPAEESTAYLQLVRDTGDAICIPLFQVQHSAICGPTIGSLSMLPDLQLRDCEAVAMERSWQAALLGLPFGGASYGLVCDPAEFSERELMQLLGLAGRQLRKARAAGSLLFPGRGCDRQFTAKLFAEMRNSHDLKVTGKPDCLGGVHFDQFAAEGVAAIVSSACSPPASRPTRRRSPFKALVRWDRLLVNGWPATGWQLLPSAIVQEQSIGPMVSSSRTFALNLRVSTCCSAILRPDLSAGRICCTCRPMFGCLLREQMKFTPTTGMESAHNWLSKPIGTQ